jgi:hypothetical protein
MRRTKRGRDRIAASPQEMLAANADDGGGGAPLLKQITPDLQGANDAALPRCVHQPVYLLRLQARSDVDDIRALRWALKKLLRLGLRCVSVEVQR